LKAKLLQRNIERASALHNITGFQQAELMRVTIASVSLKLIFTLLTLTTSVLLARQLGDKGYGIYAYAFSLINLMVLPSQLGLPVLLVREMAAYRARAEWARMRGLLLRTSQFTLLISLLWIAAASILAWWQEDWLLKGASTTFLWALPLLPLLVLNNLRGAALRGLHRVLQGQLPEQLLRPGFFVIALGGNLLFCGSECLTPTQAMLLHVLATALAFAIGMILLRRNLPQETQYVAPIYDTRSWMLSALPLAFLAGMQVINSQTDIVMLGFFTTANEVGIYWAVVQSAMLVTFTLEAINMILAPRISHLYTIGDRGQLQQMITWSARVILLTALPIGLCLIFFGHIILEEVFGPRFGAGHKALVILCAGQLINAGAGQVGLLLTMSGHERVTAGVMAMAAAVNVILNLVLVPQLGMAGAATATAISLILWNGVLIFQVRKRLAIVSTAIHFRRRLA
jgi:O-antigen/teichoic acid export membrane protein